MDRIIRKPFMNIFFRIPYFFMGISFTGQHYWEMGRKNNPRTKVRSKLKKYFDILSEVRPVLNHNHHFFVL